MDTTAPLYIIIVIRLTYNRVCKMFMWQCFYVATHTPSEASRVALTPVARTLSSETDSISLATVPMLTIFTCASQGARVTVICSSLCLLVWINLCLSHSSSRSICQFTNISQATVCPFKSHYWYYDSEKGKKEICFSQN